MDIIGSVKNPEPQGFHPPGKSEENLQELYLTLPESN